MKQNTESASNNTWFFSIMMKWFNIYDIYRTFPPLILNKSIVSYFHYIYVSFTEIVLDSMKTRKPALTFYFFIAESRDFIFFTALIKGYCRLSINHREMFLTCLIKNYESDRSFILFEIFDSSRLYFDWCRLYVIFFDYLVVFFNWSYFILINWSIISKNINSVLVSCR